MSAQPASSHRHWLPLTSLNRTHQSEELRMGNGRLVRGECTLSPWPSSDIYRARVSWLDNTNRLVGTVEVDFSRSHFGLHGMDLAHEINAQRDLGIAGAAIWRAWGKRADEIEVLGRPYVLSMDSGLVNSLALELLTHSLALSHRHVLALDQGIGMIHFVADAMCWVSQHRGPSEFRSQHEQELEEYRQLQRLFDDAEWTVTEARRTSGSVFLVPPSQVDPARLTTPG